MQGRQLNAGEGQSSALALPVDSNVSLLRPVLFLTTLMRTNSGIEPGAGVGCARQGFSWALTSTVGARRRSTADERTAAWSFLGL